MANDKYATLERVDQFCIHKFGKEGREMSRLTLCRRAPLIAISAFISMLVNFQAFADPHGPWEVSGIRLGMTPTEVRPFAAVS
jgi:hypothetical protein